jgi:hypothetical protein
MSFRTLRADAACGVSGPRARPGQHVRFKVANIPGKGFAYWAFFMGVALMWTKVERNEGGPLLTVPIPRIFRV